jgi:ParB-like chromosome segregation protein Spo0J
MPPSIEVKLEFIRYSRYQTRDTEDRQHIEQLAVSIATAGMQQIPAGRLISGATDEPITIAEMNKGYGRYEAAFRANVRVELAYGHSRYSAYVLLDAVQKCIREKLDFDLSMPADVIEAAGDAWHKGIYFERFPVVIRDLVDIEMFELGVRENHDRKQLNALEVAKAMEVYREQFRKTSVQIGQLFRMSDSTVRGKLRLLGLPEAVQTQLAGVPEQVLREILVMLDLPEDYRKRAELIWDKDVRPSMILYDAANGAKAEGIGQRVTKMITNWGKDLSQAPWKHDREDWNADINVRGACKGCTMRCQRDKTSYCLESPCYAAKENIWEIEYLRQASFVSGIAVLDSKAPNSGSYTEFSYSEENVQKTARAAGCENLALIYTKYKDSKEWNRVPEFECALIICKKRSGFCTCGAAVKAGVTLATPSEQSAVSAVAADGSYQPAQAVRPTLTAEDLKDVARDVRNQKKQNTADVRFLASKMAGIFAQALKADNPAVWFEVWRGMTYQAKEGSSFDEIAVAIARLLVERIYNAETSYAEPTPALAVKAYNGFLRRAGLPELDGVPGVEADPPAKPQGKSIAEVFAAAEQESEEITRKMLEGETLAQYFKRTDSEVAV